MLSCDRVNMEYTDEKNFVIPFTFVPVKVQMLPFLGNKRYIILATFIRRQCLSKDAAPSPRDRKCNIYAVMDAGRPRTVRIPNNKDATFVSVEQEPSNNLWDMLRVSPKYFWTIVLYGYNFVNGSCINLLWMCYGYTVFFG